MVPTAPELCSLHGWVALCCVDRPHLVCSVTEGHLAGVHCPAVVSSAAAFPTRHAYIHTLVFTSCFQSMVNFFPEAHFENIIGAFISIPLKLIQHLSHVQDTKSMRRNQLLSCTRAM